MTGYTDCHTCAQETDLIVSTGLPPRDAIAYDDHWRLAHAFGVALPGWLMLIPRRHVTAVAELDDAEAASLGAWQVRASRALHAVTGCAKTYVAQFSEAEGFSHTHFHIVPRQADIADELRGPRIFALMGSPEGEVVKPALMDEISLAVRERLEQET
jgi:diadenosine tetraphosphate (Ap4A) HIT family hydrolase